MDPTWWNQTLVSVYNLRLITEIDFCIALLSAIGCITNISLATYWKTIGYEKIMVIGISTMDFISSIAALFLPVDFGDNTTLCQVVSFWKNFGFGGSFAWSCCIAHSLYIQINKGRDPTNCIFYYVCISVFVALYNGILAVVTHYSEIISIGLCYHMGATGYGNYLVNTVPSLIAVFICLTFYCMITRSRIYKEENLRGLFFYPLILIVCIGPKLYKDLSEQITKSPSPDVLYFITAPLYLSQGLWNSIAYGISRVIVAHCKLKVLHPTQSMNSDDQYEELTVEPIHGSADH